MLLAVVNPTNDRYHAVHERLVVHAVFAVEMDSLWIDTMKQVVGVYRRVLVAEETIDAVQLVVGDTLEALFRLILVLLDQCFVNIEFLDTIQSWILELLSPRHSVRLHCLAHLQGSIHADAVVAIELLGIHAPHRCADDEVWMLLLADVAQQGDGLCRMDGQVGGNDFSLWHYLTESCHRTRLSAAGKTVTVEYCLACHQLRKLLDVWIFCYHVCKDTNFFVTLQHLTLK